MRKTSINMNKFVKELEQLNNAMMNLNKTMREMVQVLSTTEKPERKTETKIKRRLSIRDHIVDVLLGSKRAMHYRNITKQVIKRGYKFHRKDPERSVYIIIKRYPKLFEKTKPATYKLRPRSIRDHIIDILKRSEEPLHYRKITRLIKKRGYKFHRKNPERSVYITINRNPKIFKKTKPAMYRLRQRK